MLMTFLAGCDVIPPEYEKYWVQLQKEWNTMLIVLTGGKVPAPEVSAVPSPVATEEFASKNARDAKANAELLHEVYKVVYLREPKDRGEFGNLVDSMNQGASLEGMYNGFTHSTDYRKLEMSTGGASPEALRAFGEELAVFETELPVPVEFDAAATQPLAQQDPGAEGAAPPTPIATPRADGVNVIEYGKVPEPGVTATPTAEPVAAASPGGPKADARVLAERYTKQFVGASIFTLKRVLGDEALRVVAVKREYPEKLASWYSKWVVHMAALGVDFGISQRNKADEVFHYKWAMTASEDRLNWEVLNRVHRVLNEANRQKQ
jgi:hypothetical protein